MQSYMCFLHFIISQRFVTDTFLLDQLNNPITRTIFSAWTNNVSPRGSHLLHFQVPISLSGLSSRLCNDMAQPHVNIWIFSVFYLPALPDPWHDKPPCDAPWKMTYNFRCGHFRFSISSTLTSSPVSLEICSTLNLNTSVCFENLDIKLWPWFFLHVLFLLSMDEPGTSCYLYRPGHTILSWQKESRSDWHDNQTSDPSMSMARCFCLECHKSDSYSLLSLPHERVSIELTSVGPCVTCAITPGLSSLYTMLVWQETLNADLAPSDCDSTNKTRSKPPIET